MAFDFKAAIPDTTVPDGSFIMGADSQAASDPSLYTIVAMATKLLAVGTSPGSDTQVLFNDGGLLAGDAGLTFNKTTNALTITGTGGATLTNPATEVLQLGVDGTPGAQVFRAAATTSGVGPAFYIKGGQGSGSNAGGALYLDGGISGAAGTGGAIIFRTAPAAAGDTLATSITLSATPAGGAAAGTATLILGASGSNISPALYRGSGGSLTVGRADDGTPRAAMGIIFASAITGITTLQGGFIGFSNATTALTTVGTGFHNPSANIIEMKNSTNAQEYRVYENTTGTIYKAIKGDRQLIKIAGAAFTDGAAASSGTLTNAPAAGNPTKWIPLDDNGTTRYIPAW